MADKKVKLGILLPTRGLLLKGEQPVNMERVFELAETVEKAGLDSVWVGDSLVAKPRVEPLSVLERLLPVPAASGWARRSCSRPFVIRCY